MNSLLMSKDELQSRLEDRLSEGRTLLNTMQTELQAGGRECEERDQESRRWHDYNETLLLNAFTDASEAESYRQELPITIVRQPPDYCRSAIKRLQAGLSKLQSVIDRLEFFEEVGQAMETSTSEQREAYLLDLFRRTGGSATRPVASRDIAARLGFSDRVRDDIEEYLNEEGLLQFVAMGPMVALTHKGRLYCERGSKPADPLPPQQVVTIFGDVSNANIGQAGGDLSQQIGLSQDLDYQLREYLEALHDALLKHQEEMGDHLAEIINASYRTIEAQLDSPAPDRSVISRSLQVIQQVLISAAGGLASHGVVTMGSELLSQLGA